MAGYDENSNNCSFFKYGDVVVKGARLTISYFEKGFALSDLVPHYNTRLDGIVFTMTHDVLMLPKR